MMTGMTTENIVV